MKYEINFIISSTLPENEHSKLQEQVLSYLDEAKAKQDGEFFSLGRKKLAYPIKSQKNGFYMFMVFEMDDKSGLRELDTKLKHNGNILRHLIIKKDKSAKSPAEQVKSYEQHEDKEKDSKSVRKSNNKSTKPDKKEPKVSLDDIDKKLDELLD